MDLASLALKKSEYDTYQGSFKGASPIQTLSTGSCTVQHRKYIRKAVKHSVCQVTLPYKDSKNLLEVWEFGTNWLEKLQKNVCLR